MRSAGGVILAAVLSTCVAFASGVAAQSAVALDRVEVALWPEYDRPGVLVIYRIAIAPSTSLPASLSFTLPAAAGVPNAVAQLSGGNLVSLPYDRIVEGDRAEIRFAATEPTVQIEYYDPAIDNSDGLRSFVYEWPGDYPVGDLRFSVQEPAGSSEFATSPPAGSASVGADGLAYHSLINGPMAPGQTAQVAVSYRKQGDQLTVQASPPPTAPPAAPRQAASSPTAPAAADGWGTLVVAGLLVLGVAGLTLGLAARMRHGSGAKRSERTGKGSGKRFCTGCGSAMKADDRFCAGCGRKAR